MIKNSQKQNGSALVVVVIILVVALIGALGYIFWQNFIKAGANETNTHKVEVKDISAETPQQIENKMYEDEVLSFEYPGEGWKLVDSMGVDDIASLETDDYKPNVGMGLEAGASLVVYHTNQQEVPSNPGVSDVKEIKVDGNKGFKYAVEYEGYRMTAFFTVNVGTNDEKNYGMTMQTVDRATDSEREAFDLVLNSLDVK